jgi:hypothetical protein
MTDAKPKANTLFTLLSKRGSSSWARNALG